MLYNNNNNNKKNTLTNFITIINIILMHENILDFKSIVGGSLIDTCVHIVIIIITKKTL